MATLKNWMMEIIFIGAFLINFSNCYSQEAKSIKNDPPFELILNTVNDSFAPFKLAIQVSLKNKLNSNQAYLSNSDRQISKLSFVSSTGESIEAYDRRLIEEPSDPNIYKSMVKQIAPQKEAVLFTGQPQKSGDLYTILWGPIDYRKIRPGTYIVKAIWSSTISHYREKKGAEEVPIKNIWLGTIESKPISLIFP